MPNALDSFSNRPVLLDGAWGTELQALGLRLGAYPDPWNLTFPERVQQVAQSYIDAGSKIILSNTFGANRLVLEGYGLRDQVTAINRKGVEISRAAAGTKAKVFASLGPSGKHLSMREVTATTLTEVFTEQAQALAEGGADALVLETFTDLEELSIALTAAKATGLPVVACMVYATGAKTNHAALDDTLARAVTRLSALGADVLGANCGCGIDAYLPICARLKQLTELPLWFKPNAGLPKFVDGKATYEITPEAFAEKALALFATGAQFVGGCCGSNPAFITELARRIA